MLSRDGDKDNINSGTNAENIMKLNELKKEAKDVYDLYEKLRSNQEKPLEHETTKISP